MRIWELAPLGKRLARSTQNPDTDAWRIVHFLDRVGRSTTDQIVEGARAPNAAGQLIGLRNKQIVQESGGPSYGTGYGAGHGSSDYHRNF